MTSYTQTFGGTSILPAGVAYQAVAMSANVVWQWPVEPGGGPSIAAAVNDINASGAGLAINLPSALLVSSGTALLLNNVGSFSVAIRDYASGSIFTLAAGTAWQIYLTDNSTAAGTWRIFQYGAGSSVVQANGLAGAGLTVINGQLSESFTVSSKAVNYAATDVDRAQTLLWTGGAGTFTIAAVSTLSATWFVCVKNGGSGALTITPTSGTIDSASSLILNPNDSCYLFRDGSNLFSFGLGQQAIFAFSYIAINVAGTGDFTLNSSQQNQISYSFTGLLTGNRNIIVPNTIQQYWVGNNTTGAFTFTVKTAAGTGVAMASGSRAILFCDGVNVLNASTGGIAVPIGVASGGTGATTAGTARTNLGSTSLGDSLFTAASQAAAQAALDTPSNATAVSNAILYAAAFS